MINNVNKIIIAFNGEPLTWVDCGIKYYTVALLNELFSRDDNYFYDIYIPAPITVDLKIPQGKGRIIKSARVNYLPRKLGYINNVIWEVFSLAGVVNRSGASLFFSPWQARTTKHLSMPSIVVVHDTLQWDRNVEDRAFGPQLVYNLYAKGVKKANSIITISEASKKDIVKFLDVPASSVTVAYEALEQVFEHRPSGADVESTLKDLKVNRPYILYVGSFHGRKNVLGVVESFIKFATEPKHKDWELVIIAGAKKIVRGRTNPNDVMRMARERGLANRVKILYSLPRSQILPLYAGADIFLYLSLYEGFGLPPLEAMSQDVPVISSNVSSLPEVVGDAGILVDPSKINDVVLQLKRLADDKKLRGELIAKGKRRVQHFTWKKTADIIQAEINRLLSKGMNG